MEPDKLLQEILRCEAKEANWGAKASELKKEYATRFSKYKRNDLVRTVHNNKDCSAKVNYVKFVTSPYGFVYYLKRLKADGFEDDNCEGIRKYENDILPLTNKTGVEKWK